MATSEESKRRRTEAGCRNLMTWKAENPGVETNRKHGARSQTIRKRYSDLRTAEGRRLKAVIDAIVDDLGGAEQVNAGQQLILSGLRAKLIVVFQISEYLDRQDTIVDNTGVLLPCLGRNFLTYAESIRRDLESIYGFDRRVKGRIPTIEELIARNKEQAE